MDKMTREQRRKTLAPRLTGTETLDYVGDLMPGDEKPLARVGETPAQHRALLLYAMQDPGRRSYHVTSRAMNVADGTIRNWALRWDWGNRIEREGVLGGQFRAIQLYRAMYFASDGEGKVRCIEENMSVPFFTAGPMPVNPPVEAVKLADRIVKEAEEMAVAPLPKTVEERPGATKILARCKNGLEGMLGLYFKQLSTRDGQEKLVQQMKPNDVYRAIEAYQALSQVLGIETVAVSGLPGVSALEPTYRVQLAALNGTPVEDALLDDALELVAIHQALRERRLQAEREEEAIRATRSTENGPSLVVVAETG